MKPILNAFKTYEITPRGWMKKQLEIQAASLSGELYRVWRDVRDSKWIGGDAEGWERVPYWLDGFIPLAFLLRDEEKIAVAKKYVDAIFAGQAEDGWICPCTEEERPGYDMWGLILLTKVLVVWHGCTDDARVEPALRRALRNFYDRMKAGTTVVDRWAKARWFETFFALTWLDAQGHEDWITELAQMLLDSGADYLSFEELWKIPLNTWTFETHVVNAAMAVKGESAGAELRGLKNDATPEKLWRTLMKYNGMAAGIFTGDECLSGLSPVQGCELCAVVELMFSMETLGQVFGKTAWFDRLEKAAFKTDDPIEEMGIKNDVIAAPISQMVKDCLADTGMDNKSMLKCRNMFALGLVCWLFNRDLSIAENFLREKFAKKPAIAEANIKVIHAGYDYGHNTHSSVAHTYRIESKTVNPGKYMDITGNKATAYGFIAAAEKAGLKLFLGSYPITPATDVLHELSKHKSLGVVTVQCEDEIAGCASAVGASYAGALAVTSTSGPGICLKSEAMNLAVIMELPLVVLDVQRGGPATGLPTKSEQTDLLQVLFGRNGESPMPVLAATSPTDCFEAAYEASKIALEHMTPVVLLTDAFVANGSAAWKLPKLAEYPAINPPFVPAELKGTWTPYQRNAEGVRYWAVPGTEGFTHILGGLEKDNATGAISTNPENHHLMTQLRQQKIDNIQVPDVVVEGDKDDAELLIIGFGGTYGHLHAAMDEMRAAGKKVALAHFKYINPLPANTEEVLKKYPKVVVAEQNMGQFAGYLRMKIDGFVPNQYNEVKGQPFVVNELVAAFTEIYNN